MTDEAKANVMVLAAEFKDVFWNDYLKKLDSALKSGALSESDIENSPMIVIKSVLVIAAEGVKPMSPYGKGVLANLRYFV